MKSLAPRLLKNYNELEQDGVSVKMASVFANNLRRIREERGVTKTAIARQLGITLTAYSFYEQGSTEPSLTNVKKIADYLGVSVNEFFDGIATTEQRELRSMSLDDVWGLAGFEIVELEHGYVRIVPPECCVDCFPLELKHTKLRKLTWQMLQENERLGRYDARVASTDRFEWQAKLVTNRRAAMRRENPFNNVSLWDNSLACAVLPLGTEIDGKIKKTLDSD